MVTTGFAVPYFRAGPVQKISVTAILWQPEKLRAKAERLTVVPGHVMEVNPLRKFPAGHETVESTCHSGQTHPDINADYLKGTSLIGEAMNIKYVKRLILIDEVETHRHLKQLFTIDC